MAELSKPSGRMRVLPTPARATADITVFAAASTTNALTEIARIYEAGGNGNVALSFASSSTLAKQIENGAPADVFLSADTEWMQYLEDKALLEPGAGQIFWVTGLFLLFQRQVPCSL